MIAVSKPCDITRHLSQGDRLAQMVKTLSFESPKSTETLDPSLKQEGVVRKRIYYGPYTLTPTTVSSPSLTVGQTYSFSHDTSEIDSERLPTVAHGLA